MDSPKALAIKMPRRRLGWRILLCMAGFLGAMHFVIGLAFRLNDWKDPELQHHIWFSMPYSLLMLLFMGGFGLAWDNKVRASIVLIILGLVLSAGLCSYDVHYERAQMRVGPRGEPFYMFWWWWKWIEEPVHSYHVPLRQPIRAPQSTGDSGASVRGEAPD